MPKQNFERSIENGSRRLSKLSYYFLFSHFIIICLLIIKLKSIVLSNALYVFIENKNTINKFLHNFFFFNKQNATRKREIFALHCLFLWEFDTFDVWFSCLLCFIWNLKRLYKNGLSRGELSSRKKQTSQQPFVIKYYGDMNNSNKIKN